MKPNKRITVATLLASGTSQREIARLTGVDRKTIRRLTLGTTGAAPNSPTPATGVRPENPPPRPPASDSGPQSLCEPHRAFIEAQLRLRRNYTSIYQDLVDQFGFTGRYNSVKGFAGRLVRREPEQFDRLEFAPGEEAQVDYGAGALTRIPGSDRYRRPRLFVMTLRYSRRSFRRVVWNSSKETWAQLHEQAFRYFGGTTYLVARSVIVTPTAALERGLMPPGGNRIIQLGMPRLPALARPVGHRDWGFAMLNSAT